MEMFIQMLLQLHQQLFQIEWKTDEIKYILC